MTTRNGFMWSAWAAANGLDNLSSRWHDPECRENATVDDSMTTSQLRRHTGGVQARQSARAIANDDPGHFDFVL
jgi:hypothetical protein